MKNQTETTQLFDKYLETILPVSYITKEPKVRISFGTSRRSWRADYCFKLERTKYIV